MNWELITFDHESMYHITQTEHDSFHFSSMLLKNFPSSENVWLCYWFICHWMSSFRWYKNETIRLFQCLSHIHVITCFTWHIFILSCHSNRTWTSWKSNGIHFRMKTWNLCKIFSIFNILSLKHETMCEVWTYSKEFFWISLFLHFSNDSYTVQMWKQWNLPLKKKKNLLPFE